MGVKQDLEKLKEWGRRLDGPADRETPGRTQCEALMQKLLKIRTKEGKVVELVPNEAQLEFGERLGRKNIVLKARQLGISTYVAARYFIKTITQPGTLTVQVAHDQSSAEEIFCIVRRFQENLPDELRTGVLRTSRANVRQIVFPELDAIADRQIVDPNKFHDGLGKVIDGVVDCLNASVWAKQK